MFMTREFVRLEDLEIGDNLVVWDQDKQEFVTEELSEVVELPEEEEVYDITVEDSHNWVGNSLCVSNTRWREDDPVGVLQSKIEELKGEGIDITLSTLCFRAFYDPTDEFAFDFRSSKDEMLWPEFQEISYAKAKIAKSKMVYNALFQQRPIDFAETIFKEKDINRFATIDNIDFMKMAISVDTNYKDKETSDKCAIGVIGLTKEYRYYLIDLVYDHMTFPDALKEIFKVIQKYPNYTDLLVEAKSNGQAIIDTLKLKLPAVVEIEPCDSKRARAYAVQPVFENGKVYIMDNREGDTAIQQICGFKGLGKREKDDIVDILTQTINYYDEQFKASLQSEDITVVRNESNLLDFTPNSGNSQEMMATFNKINNSIFDKYKGNCNWL